jgi:hypothetical protein
MSTEAIDLLAERFARALAAHPLAASEQVVMVAGAPVRARVVGSELAMILGRALVPADGVADRETDRGGDGILELALWDESATGVGLEERPSRPGDHERWGPAGERLGITPDGRYLRFGGPDFEIRLDRIRQRAVGWVRSASLLSSWHRARPLQTLFAAWIGARGATAVHAALISRPGAGVLLPGPGLSGKSTVTAACGESGFGLLGDDTAVLELCDQTVHGHCMHAAIKLRRAGLDRHPGLAGIAHDCGPGWEDEAVVFAREAFPGQAVASVPLAALAFPTLSSDAETAFAPIPRAEALRILMGCVLSVEPGKVGEAFATVADAVDRIPAYRLSVGSATDRIPDAVDAMIDACRSRAAARRSAVA